MVRIGFGGGCHWCTEAVFQSLSGVTDLRQGFIRSIPPHDSYSEAVEIVFDPSVISLDALIRVHLATHASTAAHSMRGKYRSAIYTCDQSTAEEASHVLFKAGQENGIKFVTMVLPHGGFKPSDERFHNYHENDPERPFCRTYIHPKLAKLRHEFSELLKGSRAAS